MNITHMKLVSHCVNKKTGNTQNLTKMQIQGQFNNIYLNYSKGSQAFGFKVNVTETYRTFQYNIIFKKANTRQVCPMTYTT